LTELEDRVTALETRVDALTVEVRHATDLSITATREAHTAREAHQRNIELLNALRATQAEHSRTLAEHGRMLAEHSTRLDRIDGRLENIESKLGRIDAIDGRLGQLALGMHTIESLLREMIEQE
jgi:uncharacterized coiled-coil protein SlyX